MSRQSFTLSRRGRDPFGLFRQMTSELDRVLDEGGWTQFRWPAFRADVDAATWFPEIEVFEQDNTLVTRIDLPGLKKEDVKVEVDDGQLAISGERKREVKEQKENVYRSEREYGSFFRTVALPEGVKADAIKATFVDGVLEVRVPLPAKVQAAPKQVAIEGGAEPAKAA